MGARAHKRFLKELAEVLDRNHVSLSVQEQDGEQVIVYQMLKSESPDRCHDLCLDRSHTTAHEVRIIEKGVYGEDSDSDDEGSGYGT